MSENTSSLVPSYQEIIDAVGARFGVEIRVTEERTRNMGIRLDAQGVVVHLLKAVYGATYVEASDILKKDVKPLHAAHQKAKESRLLMLTADEIYSNLLVRPVDQIELETAVNKLALGHYIPGHAFIGSLIIHRLRGGQ